MLLSFDEYMFSRCPIAPAIMYEFGMYYMHIKFRLGVRR